MKINPYIYIFFCICVFFLNSCNKKKEDNEEKPVASMSAKINDVVWPAVSWNAIHENKTLTVKGISSDGQVIEVTFMGDALGSYKLDSTTIGFTGIYKADSLVSPFDSYISTSGTSSLSKINLIDKQISGTFSFIAKKSIEVKKITQGVFSNISYSDQ